MGVFSLWVYVGPACGFCTRSGSSWRPNYFSISGSFTHVYTKSQLFLHSKEKRLLCPPAWAVPPELLVLQGVNAAYKSQDLVSQPGLEHASKGNARPTHYLCGYAGYSTYLLWLRTSDHPDTHTGKISMKVLIITGTFLLL